MAAVSLVRSGSMPLAISRHEHAFAPTACAGSLLDGRPHGHGVIDKNGEQAACTFDEGTFVCYNNPKDW